MPLQSTYSYSCIYSYSTLTVTVYLNPSNPTPLNPCAQPRSNIGGADNATGRAQDASDDLHRGLCRRSQAQTLNPRA